MAEQTTAVSLISKMEAKYEIFGQSINLTPKMVRELLVRGDASKVTDTDIVEFISMCKFNKLNPFTKEAFLVKYGDKPASIITSQEAFMKRADACEEYDGIESGIIVVRDGHVLDLNGAFKLPTDTLVGGWAIVHRTDKKHPFEARISMAEYDKGQSTWKQMPCTMINKCAKVAALRMAFPTQLGAMYISDEMPSAPIDIPHEDVTNQEIQEKANKQDLPPEPQPEAKPEGKSDVPPELQLS